MPAALKRIKLKSGINTPLVCKKCGHRLGFIKLKTKVKWQTVKWAIGLGLLFEIIANIVVFLLFR